MIPGAKPAEAWNRPLAHLHVMLRSDWSFSVCDSRLRCWNCDKSVAFAGLNNPLIISCYEWPERYVWVEKYGPAVCAPFYEVCPVHESHDDMASTRTLKKTNNRDTMFRKFRIIDECTCCNIRIMWHSVSERCWNPVSTVLKVYLLLRGWFVTG
jgi:hypothetical protein